MGKPFGELLKELRGEGTTQKELAEKAGLSLGGIRHYEQGQSEPVFSQLLRIARALGVGLEAFNEAEPAPLKKKKAKPKPVKKPKPKK